MKITSTLRHVHSENRENIIEGLYENDGLFFSLKWVDQFRNIS